MGQTAYGQRGRAVLSAALAALGMLSWPASVAPLGGTARPAVPRPGPARRRFVRVRPVAGLIFLATLVIAVVAGPVVGLSAGLVLVTVAALVSAELTRAREQHDLAQMLAATRTLARELRSGAAPLAAIGVCAAAHRGMAADVLSALAVDVAGDRGRITPPAAETGPASEVTGRLARGWALSARYGVPWASLVEAVSVDLADRLRAAAQRNAQVSGPRVSGYVLAAMPVLGVLLGIGMGADPLHVLLGTAAGRMLLLGGCVLVCAGLAWTARIVRG